MEKFYMISALNDLPSAEADLRSGHWGSGYRGPRGMKKGGPLVERILMKLLCGPPP